MPSTVQAALTSLTSGLQTLGLFTSVDTVEPKQGPLAGINAALYLAEISPKGSVSGLDKGTCLYEFTLRLYSDALQQPADQIDPNLISIVDKVWDLLCGEFTLGGNVRNIDILGEVSPGLRARAGHVDVGGTMYRAIDMSIPLIVNDTITWTP